MDKLTQADATSQDIVMDNIDKLKAIFPEAVTEGKIDFDALKETLGEYLETREERYNFSWAGKSKARRLAQTPTTGTLRPCPEESVDWEKTENLFIEGDNLEVLKLLQKSYQGQVKMIYIDPPYNTGKDFVYPDKYADNLKGYLEYTGQTDADGHKNSTNTESNGRFHTNWLNMITPRLHLARNLLQSGGLIFISIDDGEEANLRLVCDSIFGEENRLDRGSIIWKSACSPRGFNHIVKDHEFILAYAKNIEHVDYDSIVLEDTEPFDGQLWIARTPANPIAQVTFPVGVRCEGHDRIINGTIGSGRTRLDIIGEFHVQNGKLAKPVTLEGSWPSKNQLIQYLNRSGDEEIFDTKGQKWLDVYFTASNFPIVTKDRGRKSMRSIIDDCGNTGTPDVKSLNLPADFPKPVKLLKKILRNYVGTNGIILDFFSGSCSTAHAIFELNEEDGGNLNFIMVQLPEVCPPESDASNAGFKTIAEIGKERIRRAAAKIKEENPDYDGDLGFKVFKLDSSNIDAWDSNVENLEENVLKAANVLKDDRSELDIVYELFLKYGLDLSYPVNTHEVAGKKVYEIGAGSLFICMEDGITNDFVEALIQLYETFDSEAAPRVVLKDSGFKTDAAKKDAESTLRDAGILDVKCL